MSGLVKVSKTNANELRRCNMYGTVAPGIPPAFFLLDRELQICRERHGIEIIHHHM